jgi:hypothetical protein
MSFNVLCHHDLHTRGTPHKKVRTTLTYAHAVTRTVLFLSLVLVLKAEQPVMDVVENCAYPGILFAVP